MELLKGLKWVILLITVLAVLVISWCGAAWVLGWYAYKFFDLKNFGPENYVQFGSSVLVFMLIVQVITIIITGWFLISWGKSRGLKQGEAWNNPQEKKS